MLNNPVVTKYCYGIGQPVCEANVKSTRNVVVSHHKGGKVVSFG